MHSAPSDEPVHSAPSDEPASLLAAGRPFTLRKYQADCVEVVRKCNTICALPVGSGKTVIAAAIIQETLMANAAKKVVFLAPYGALAQQQFDLLMRQIDQLHTGEDVTTKLDATAAELARWRAGLVVGTSIESEMAISWRRAVTECQLLVMTPALFEKALMHASLRMADVELLVVDEAHHARVDSAHFYSTIMAGFYHPARREERPRILGLTASPAHLDADMLDAEPSRDVVRTSLATIEQTLDATIWSASSDELRQSSTEDGRDGARPASAPRWTGDFEVRHYREAARLPAEVEELAVDVRQCVASLGLEASALCVAWERRIVDKVRSVGEELGVWGCYEAVALLADDLCRARVKESVWLEHAEEREEHASGSEQLQALTAALSDVKVQAEWGGLLKAALDARVRPDPRDAAARTDKVDQLVAVLEEKQPTKCLVFATRRVTCKLLAEMVPLLLPTAEWSVDCLMAVKPSSKDHSEAFAASEYSRSIHNFRASLRVLITTATVEEGLDVPSCDAVINFDAPMEPRSLLQRGGRARAPNSSYVTLVDRSDTPKAAKTLERQHRLRTWLGYVDDELSALRRPDARRAPIPPRVPVDLDANALETPKGALLLLERARDFLKTKVYRADLSQDLRGENAAFATADGTKFGRGDSSKSGVQYIVFEPADIPGGGKYFTCRMHLPRVRLCSAKPDGATLELMSSVQLDEAIDEATRQPRRFPSKLDAENHTSLAACRLLHAAGIIDDELQITGRREIIAELNARSSAPRGSRRANAWDMAMKEPVVRKLPKCFDAPAALLSDSVGDADAAEEEEPTLRLYVHMIFLNGIASGRGLLLSAPCGIEPPFQLGPDGKPRQQCRLSAGAPLVLTRSQLAELSECHVAELDLVQGGNAREPLHSSLAAAPLCAPSQLIHWDSELGTYRPMRIDGAAPPTAEAAAHSSRPHAGGAGVPMSEAQLAERLLPFVTTARRGGGSGGSDARPLVPVFDLDQTLWGPGNCDEFDANKLRRWHGRAADGGLRVYQPDDEPDAPGRFLELHRDVPLIFAALRKLQQSHGAKFAIASASAAHASAHALLAAFDLDPSTLVVEMRRDTDDPHEGKAPLLRRVSEQLEVSVDTLVLFDDLARNLKDARGLGGGGRLVDPIEGVTGDAVLRGLEYHQAELSERVRLGVNAEGFTAKEMSQENVETRRKLRQAREGRESEQHAAQCDEAPAQAQLRRTAVEPGWWLSVPLAAEGEIDWAHVQRVREYCTTCKCKWPTLNQSEDPLVKEHLHMLPPAASTAAGGGGGGGGGERPVARLDLCTLMRRPNMHTDLFTNVTLHADGSVSGEKRTRGLNVSATAATRTQQADGRHVTEHTLYRAGYDPRLVHVLPLRAAHVDVLQCLRRLVWRVQHLALVVEQDGMRALRAAHSSAAWLPEASVPVPLSLLAAALTHSGAAAEAVEPLPAKLAADTSAAAVVRFDASRMDSRGCFDYEVSEWSGDAVLDLVTKSSVMQRYPYHDVSELNPLAEDLLRNKHLHLCAKAYGISPLALTRPFEAKARLPELTKQLVAPKQQADLMEAMMGAAQLEALSDSPRKLSAGLDAALAFFNTFVSPPEAAARPAAGMAAAVMGSSSGTDLLNSSMSKLVRNPQAGAATGQERADDIRYAFGLEFANRADLLFECCVWHEAGRGEGKQWIVFQRLELLGDAFLQYVVSMELRARFPDKRHGELTEMRAALVSNLHLGRLLVQRFGQQRALRFFELSDSLRVPSRKEKLDAIRAFIAQAAQEQDVVGEGEAPNVIAALKQHAQEMRNIHEKARAEERAARAPPDGMSSSGGMGSGGMGSGSGGDGVASGQWYDRRGIDHRKATGDTYEALVGLLLLELGGHCDECWSILRPDFFPSSASEGEGAAAEEDARRLAEALREAKQATDARERKRKTDELKAAASSTEVDVAVPSPPAASVVEVAARQAMAACAAAADASSVAAAASAAAPEKRARGPPNDVGEQGTCKRTCPTVPPQGSAGSTAGSSTAGSSAAPYPIAAVVPVNEAVKHVNELLAKAGIGRNVEPPFVADDCRPTEGQGPFTHSVYVLGVRLGVGVAEKKKEAKANAYHDLCAHHLDELMERIREWRQQPQALQAVGLPPRHAGGGGNEGGGMPPPPSPPPPAPPPLTPPPPAPPPTAPSQPLPAPLPIAHAGGDEAERAHKKAALYEKVSTLLKAMRGLRRYPAPQEPSGAELFDIFTELREDDSHFQQKTAKLMQKSRIEMSALLYKLAPECVALASQSLPAQRHSAGRLFLEALEAFLKDDAAAEGGAAPVAMPTPLDPPPPAGRASPLTDAVDSANAPSADPPNEPMVDVADAIAPPPTATVLHPGDHVRIFGLEKSAQHNGTIGEIGAPLAPDTQRYAVLRCSHADSTPKDLKIRPSNLELIHLGLQHMETLSPAARQLCYYLQGDNVVDGIERDEVTCSLLLAHGNELPLYLFQTYRRLREEILEPLDAQAGRAFTPHARLDALRAAVREVPTLELCGPYADRVRRSVDAFATPEGSSSAALTSVAAPSRKRSLPGDVGEGGFNVMRLPAGGWPHVTQLPQRIDYLNVLGDALGGSAPLGMHARYAGQTSVQPMMYFLVHDDNNDGMPLNELASRLAGFSVWGDALLADATLAMAYGSEPILFTSCGVSDGSVGVYEAFLAERCGGILGFMLKKMECPLLGRWALPRCDAWPRRKVTPASLLYEWHDSPSALAPDGSRGYIEMQRDADIVPLRTKSVTYKGAALPGSKTLTLSSGAIVELGSPLMEMHENEDGMPPEAITSSVMTQLGLQGHSDVQVELEGNTLLVQAKREEPEADTPWQCTLWTDLLAQGGADGGIATLTSAPCRSKVLAKDDVALTLMRHLVGRVPPSPPLELLSVDEQIGSNQSSSASEGLAAGTSVRCACSLTLEPLSGGSSEPPVVLEQWRDETVVLGSGVLLAQVDGLLSDTGAQWQALVGPLPEHHRVESTWRLHVRYHGQPRTCRLSLAVLGVELGQEESEYELAGGTEGGTSLGQLRMRKVARILRSVGATSLADVGCGEARLLLHLLGESAGGGGGGEGGASDVAAGEGGGESLPPLALRSLVGIDVDARALGRAEGKLTAACASLDSPPAWELVCSSLDELSLSTPPDALSLIEVVEHLDSPAQAAAWVSSLLRRCAPRVVIVTTPNVEYNLNMIVNCSELKRRGTECSKRHKTLDTERLKELVQSGELCKGCAAFAAGWPPPREHYPRRNRDHKFEWSRDEFAAWANTLAKEHGYAVAFDGVGGGPFEEGPWSRDRPFHGPGPSSQVAVLERVSEGLSEEDDFGAYYDPATGGMVL